MIIICIPNPTQLITHQLTQSNIIVCNVNIDPRLAELAKNVINIPE